MFGSIPLVKGNPTVSQLRPLEHVCQQEQELSMKGITERITTTHPWTESSIYIS